MAKTKKKRKAKFKSVFQKLGENEKKRNEKRKSNPFFNVTGRRKTKNGMEIEFRFTRRLKKPKNENEIWIPFSIAIEKRLELRYTHSETAAWLFWDSSMTELRLSRSLSFRVFASNRRFFVFLFFFSAKSWDIKNCFLSSATSKLKEPRMRRRERENIKRHTFIKENENSQRVACVLSLT